mgnify:CR=1 FL=1
MGHLTTNANVACFYSNGSSECGLAKYNYCSFSIHTEPLPPPVLSRLWLYNCCLPQGELKGGRNLFVVKLLSMPRYLPSQHRQRQLWFEYINFFVCYCLFKKRKKLFLKFILLHCQFYFP